ncbi:MAG: phosphoribosyl-AMP cyclohydrolase [Terriglobia bacterium]
MELNYRDGLIPAVVQDPRTGKVLMLGYMNDAAYQKTIETGFVTFYSRSRGKLWTKGETSGHRLAVREVLIDCDRDALLVRAELSEGGCCHEGFETCFYRKLTPAGEEIVEERQFDPAKVYKDKSETRN